MTCIYALTDPRTDQVRYIGKTSRKASNRLSEHLRDAKIGRKAHVRAWLRILIAQGLRPGLTWNDRSLQ